jgi:MoxR-like ATPase
MSNSCTSCPSALGVTEARVFFSDYRLSTPMCARWGKVLGKPDPANIESNSSHFDKTACEAHASSCGDFGKARPDHYVTSTPVSLTKASHAFMPEDGGALLTTGAIGATSAQACFDCSKFRTWGGTHGVRFCGADGRILFGDLAKEAQQCVFFEGGSGKSVTEAPDLTTFFRQVKQPVKKRNTKTVNRFVDPSTYSSDAPVSEEHKEAGISAWRKISGPRGKDYYLPIFREDFFSEEERALIPRAGDEADPSLYIDHSNLLLEFAIQVYTLDNNLVLIGEPGSGKTEGVRWLASQFQMPFFRIAYNEFSDPDQYLGTPQYDPVKGTYFEPGVLPKRITRPGFLCSDEWNLAPESIQQVYRTLNDSSRSLLIYGNTFTRDLNCFHIGAINPAWDFRNTGTKTMASADTRRLSFRWMPNPSDAQMRGIITETVSKIDGVDVPKDVLDAIIKIGKDLREMASQGQLPDPWTLSQEIKVARLAEHFGLVDAYKRAYFESIDPAIAEVALTCVESVIPSGADWA